MGADGVKLLKVIDDEIDTEYMYYYLMLSHIPDTGYNRHFKYVKELKFKTFKTETRTICKYCKASWSLKGNGSKAIKRFEGYKKQ